MEHSNFLEEIGGKIRVCGLIGSPVAHSLSPLLHNSVYRALGLNYCYLPFHVEPPALGRAIKGAASLGITGLNVTSPHKEAALIFMDELAQSASAAGSVNTICFNEGAITGYSTDGEGLLWALKHERGWVSGPEKTVAILGAGGAARAVAFSLAGAGIKKLIILNRTAARGSRLKEALLKSFPGLDCSALPLTLDNLRRHVKDITLLINSLSGEPWSWEELDADLPAGVLACDLRYSPAVTPFLQWAREAGGFTLNGRGMLAGQAALSFSLFTGAEPPFNLMRSLMGD